MSEAFSLFDARHYETLDVVRGYGEWAETYDRTVGPDLDIPLLEKLAVIPWADLRGAVDLGCGTGRMGEWLRDRGIPEIWGVDRSTAMLERAAAKAIYRELRTEDIADTSFPTAHFDLATSSLVVCHLHDLAAFYAEVHRLLQPGGYFVEIDYHPFFLLRGIPTHFDRPSGESVAIENTVHLFGDRVAAALELGWSVRAMHERVVDEEWLARKPSLQRYHRQPISVCTVWQR
ncbi:MAG: class I SAM-dependent methyltransferase [Cyanobacteria bacterium J06639_1]